MPSRPRALPLLCDRSEFLRRTTAQGPIGRRIKACDDEYPDCVIRVDVQLGRRGTSRHGSGLRPVIGRRAIGRPANEPQRPREAAPADQDDRTTARVDEGPGLAAAEAAAHAHRPRPTATRRPRGLSRIPRPHSALLSLVPGRSSSTRASRAVIARGGEPGRPCALGRRAARSGGQHGRRGSNWTARSDAVGRQMGACRSR
jgi:hypothetical protein